MTAALDHLVVMAHSLDEGVAWCQATLGVTPDAGGEHVLMGTHNRLLAIAGPDHSGAYLEIIAINTIAANDRTMRTHRWFDMDLPDVQARVARHGPQLIHWVARVPDAVRAVAALRRLGLERGAVIGASRDSPAGRLQWQITVRDDGQRLLDGCLPTLIQWGEVHPATHLPARGVTLQGLSLRHPQAPLLQGALAALNLSGVQVTAGPPRLSATLHTPHGTLTLESP